MFYSFLISEIGSCATNLGLEIFADSAYVGQKQNEIIDKYELVNKVHEKGYRANPLTDEQKANNKIKSKTRARVEHIFGFMEQSMNGLCLKSIGIKRSATHKKSNRNNRFNQFNLQLI